MDLTVVIPCRNAAAQLPAMLDSLAASPPPRPWEIVVADDHSSDGTRRVAEGRADGLPIRVVDVAGGGGPGAARNAGVAVSTGELVFFLDHDDEIARGYFEAMLAALDDADVVGGRLEVERLNSSWTAGTRPESEVDGLFDHFDFLPYAPSCAMGIRREVFDALGGFAEGDGEDVDLSWRAQLRGYRIAPAPGAVLHYRYRPTLGGVVRQAITYGTAQPLLYRRFRREGMPGRPLRAVLSAYLGLVRMTAHARSRAELASVAYLLAVYTGRIKGSIRYRTAYL